MNIISVKNHLNWFFNHSDAALGFHSGHSAFISAMWSSNHLTKSDFEPTDKLLKQIKKHRKIYQALQKLSTLQYRQATALYCQEYQNKYPPIITKIFKEKTGIILTLTNDSKLLNSLCTKHYHKTLSQSEKFQLDQFVDLTNQAYTKLHAYLQTLL